MNHSREDLTLIEKIKKTVSKFCEIEVFEESPYLFEPKCIVKLNKSLSTSIVEEIHTKFREIGYHVKFQRISKYEKEKYNLSTTSNAHFYKLEFKAKIFKREREKLKKSRLIQYILLIITSGTIILSGFFYIYLLNPYYSGFGNSLFLTTTSIISFCIGMFLIVVVHEYGHIMFSRKHKLDTSPPYLIPGPPPIGMFGAFVSIKDDPRTRNQKFDVAIGGIVSGVIISLILIIIGLLLSKHVEINNYLQLRADYFGSSPGEEAEFVKEHLNYFNLVFLGFRYLVFKVPSYSSYYGYYLPESLLVIHPLAFAGWIGLCLSALNLIPLPFLDGGHVIRAVFPHPASRIIGAIVGLIIFLALHPYLFSFSFFPIILLCITQSTVNKKDETPFPMIPLTRNRKI
ncbi:MAG: site-2 protease family protein, partial [Candidatus Hermodarchaeota archaeon]